MKRLVLLLPVLLLVTMFITPQQAYAQHNTAVHHTTQPAHINTTASPIQHVVVLYLENQSFDSILGFWCDQQAQAQIDRCQGTGMPPEAPESTPPTGKHRNTQALVPPHTLPDVIPEVDHTTGAQARAMDQNPVTGTYGMDGWWRNSGCSPNSNPIPYGCIGGYTEQQIPNIASLASNYAISTATFSLKNSPSWEGHLYAVAGTTDGFTGPNPSTNGTNQSNPGWGCDSNRTAEWSNNPPDYSNLIPQPSCIPDYSLNPVNFPYGGAAAPTQVPHIPTIMDDLTAAQLSWRIYGAPTPQEQASTPFSAYNGGYLWDICPSFADCLYTAEHNSNVKASQFVTDAAAGNLPNFSLITPGGHDVYSSCHNGYTIQACDNWVGQIANAVLTGPEHASTVLFITWDDCGCFYDGIPPPQNLNADGEPPGPRSPLLIIGDSIKPAFTDTTPTTFAGILHFTENTFNLPNLGQNDAAAYDFANSFTQINTNQTLTPDRFRPIQTPVPKRDRNNIDTSQGSQDS